MSNNTFHKNRQTSVIIEGKNDNAFVGLILAIKIINGL